MLNASESGYQRMITALCAVDKLRARSHPLSDLARLKKIWLFKISILLVY